MIHVMSCDLANNAIAKGVHCLLQRWRPRDGNYLRFTSHWLPWDWMLHWPFRGWRRWVCSSYRRCPGGSCSWTLELAVAL